MLNYVSEVKCLPKQSSSKAEAISSIHKTLVYVSLYSRAFFKRKIFVSIVTTFFSASVTFSKKVKNSIMQRIDVSKVNQILCKFSADKAFHGVFHSKI